MDILSLSLSLPHCYANTNTNLNKKKNILSPMMSKPKELLSERPPDDVVFDILTRLPAKSLVRFRCVSKSWNSIITNSDFNVIRLKQAKSLSYNNNNNNGYVLYMPMRDDDYTSSREELCISVWNNDGTLTNLSKFETPFCYARIVSFCNGIYLCDSYYYNNVLYLWNPSIGKFKKLVTTSTGGVHGFAYDSQNNDFKILRMGAEVAEVYTLSTDSWRKVVISESLSESIDYIYLSSLFFNGALHSIARSGSCHFILAFDINDEIFRKIMLPQNDNFGGIGQSGLTSEWLAVLKGSLALIVISDHTPWDRNTCHISVMREYGVVESWTTKTVPLYFTQGFFGCTDNGELLIQFFESHPISFDPENLNEYLLGIEASHWLSYTAYLMESLVLLDQVKCHLNMKISMYTKISLLKFLSK
jgi:F-box interacting protein